MRLAQEVLQDGIQVIRVLERRLDASFAEEFFPTISDFMAGGPHAVVIDLSAVDFIDSRGLGVMLALYKSAVAANGELVISGAQEPILSLFRLARIGNIIPVWATEQEAVAALRQSPASEAVAGA